jgi:hypothetical protein
MMNSGARPLSHNPSSAAHSRMTPNDNARSHSDSDAETVILSDEDEKKSQHRRRSSAASIASEKKHRKSNGVLPKHSDELTPSRKSDRAQSADQDPEEADALSDDADTSERLEPRKRKFSMESQKSKLEPPRQRPRLDSKSRQNSPPSPHPHTHRRSSSMQSNLGKGLLRRKRDASTNSRFSDDKGKWADDSSEDSSTNIGRVPHLAPPKSTRGITRALPSPAKLNAAVHGRRTDRYGTTQLAKHAEKGKLDEVVKAYEHFPEELDQEDNGGFTPLQKAALGGHTDVVKFLLDKGCRKDCHCKDNKDTPLIDAVENGHLEVVKLLLNAGVNPHHSNKKGVRAIDAVSDDEDHADEIRNLLKEAMAKYQPEENDAEENTQESPVVRKRQPGAASNRPDLLYQPHNKKTLLKYALEGDLEAVGSFIESVAPDNDIVVAAARAGHDQVLSVILPFLSKEFKDPDPKEFEETPLLAAIGRNSIKVIRLLINQDNFNPCRKTKEGKTYYQVAEERKGPRWSQEVELLKLKYNEWKENRVARKKSLQESRTIAKQPSSKDSTPKSPKTAKPKMLKTEKSNESIPTKRSKEDQPRRRRPIVDDASTEESEAEPASPTRKKSTRSRHNSISVKAGVSVLASKSETDPRPKGKPGRKPKEAKEPKATAMDLDNPDSEADSKDLGGSSKISSPDPEPAIAPSKNTNTKLKKLRNGESRKQSRGESDSTLVEKEDLLFRKREMEERRIRESADAANKKREDDRLALLNSAPPPLRQALEFGRDRSLGGGDLNDLGRIQFGLQYLFTPIPVFPRAHLNPNDSGYPNPSPDYSEDTTLTLSWYAIGILGLSSLSLEEFPSWETIPATKEQLTRFYSYHDQKKIYMTYAWVEMGMEHWDRDLAEKNKAEAEEQFFNLPLSWIRVSDLKAAIEQREDLKELKWSVQERDDLGPQLEAPAESIWKSFGLSTPPEYLEFSKEQLSEKVVEVVVDEDAMDQDAPAAVTNGIIATSELDDVRPMHAFVNGQDKMVES